MVDKPFGISVEQLELARQAAIYAVEYYGMEYGEEYEQIVSYGEIYNDHVAVQSAIKVIKLLEKQDV